MPTFTCFAAPGKLTLTQKGGLRTGAPRYIARSLGSHWAASETPIDGLHDWE
jgi:hypothetical protein